MRRRTDKQTGKWYLHCENCKQKVELVEKQHIGWRNQSCLECNRTIRHDVVGTLVICRVCQRVSGRGSEAKDGEVQQS